MTCSSCGGRQWIEVPGSNTVRRCPMCRPSAAARRNDPITSKKAALDALPRQNSWQWRALIALSDAGEDGLTDYELALALRRPMHRGSVSKYRKALVDSGWVVNTGRMRRTDTGSDAIVWVAIPDAAKYVGKRGAA